MAFALNLAYEKRLITEEYKNQSLALIQKYDLITEIPEFNRKKLINLMFSDKKVENGEIKFILPTQKATVECFNIKPEEIEEITF